jgi:hypothetical protein
MALFAPKYSTFKIVSTVGSDLTVRFFWDPDSPDVPPSQAPLPPAPRGRGLTPDQALNLL